MDHIKIGKLGEDIALKYLLAKKYKIIDRNFRYKWGDEIDIIASDKNGVLVFVEVKAIRKNNSWLMPEDNASIRKLGKIKRACQTYANSHFELIEKKGWRIDLIAIDIKDNHLTNLSNDYEIRHYENI